MSDKGVLIITAIIMVIALGVLVVNFLLYSLPSTVVIVAGIAALLDLFAMCFVGARLIGSTR